MIVKPSHLHVYEGVQDTEIDFSYADSNEIRAITLAKTALKDVKVPEIYFAGKLISLATDLSDLHSSLLSDQGSSSASPRETFRCWVSGCMAVSA